jgi:nucleoside-diphosphate-sugar epimerase
METLPETISTTQQLDELLSRPRPELVDFIGKLKGDLLIIGAGGKIGPSLARMAHRAVQAAGAKTRVIAVDAGKLDSLADDGIETHRLDLLDAEGLKKLPKAPNVIYLAGRKFGSTGDEPTTWAVNVILAADVARVLGEARVVAFSTGCVYPIMNVNTGGATEDTPTAPVGEYAMSCLGRERAFDYASARNGLKVLHFRLNYAVELRYGVLVDVAQRVWSGEPVDLTTGFANVIWQGDVCHIALLCLSPAQSPPVALNVTGPETISIRQAAGRLGELLGREPVFRGAENGMGYLSNASRAGKLFGPPTVDLDRLIRWTAEWVRRGAGTLGKPTHFETQDGRF